MNDPKPNDLINWTEQIVLCQSAARAQKKHAMLSKAELRRFYTIERSADSPAVLTWTRNDASMDDADALCGCYVLRTNQTVLDASTI